MKPYRLILALACLSIASPLHAASEDAYSDWGRLKAILESQGIAMGTVNWSPVEIRCASLKSHVSDSAYYRCEFEAILLLRDFTADQSACQRQEAYERSLPPCSTSPYQFGGFDHCMLQRGWTNSNDWASGHTSHRYESLVQ